MREMLEKLMKPTPAKRLAFFLLTDALALSAALQLALQLRMDFEAGSLHQTEFMRSLPLFIALKVLVLGSFRIYSMTWRYAGVEDFMRIIGALALSEALLFALVHALIPAFGGPSEGAVMRLPRGVFPIDAALSILFLSSLRVSKRITIDALRRKRNRENGKRTLIIGAGDTGEMILRDIIRQKTMGWAPVGFIDRDRSKLGSSIHGVRVIGSPENLEEVVIARKIEQVIVALPSLSGRELKSIYETTKGLVESIKIAPSIRDFRHQGPGLKGLEEIKIEDLLGRQAVQVDTDSIGAFLRKKVVLVTGAGGSIGSEIVMQAAAFQPEKLILFDIDETELHRMELKLGKAYPEHFGCKGGAGGRFVFVVGDIGNAERVRGVFAAHAPEIVFHAAAYKHVPMMEHNPEEAVRVNMFGTHVLAGSAARSGVRKFIMISSDKAVMPSSVMGATKRMAENICAAFGSGRTAFISVRFGNVLGSRGSVLPIFMEQLESGGPLTVTHRDIKRYFMTISEAVSLVLQAAVIGKGGEVLVLDMGEPVRIADLAEELIRINGLDPHKDIGIEFTGLRAGEKLYEEVFTNEEVLKVSAHRKILISRSAASYSLREIERILGEFEPHMRSGPGQGGQLKGLLRKYVEHTADACLEEPALQGRVV